MDKFKMKNPLAIVLIIVLGTSVIQAQTDSTDSFWWRNSNPSPPPPPLPVYETAPVLRVTDTGSTGGPSYAQGLFDGDYFAVEDLYSANVFVYHNIPSDPLEDVRYLYKSDVYSNYWMFGVDFYSSNYYGYAYDSAAALASDIPTASWVGNNVKGVNIEAIDVEEYWANYAGADSDSSSDSEFESDSEFDSDSGFDSESDSTDSPTGMPTASPFTEAPTMSGNTAAPTTSPTESPTSSPTTSSPTGTSEFYWPNAAEPDASEYACATDYTTDYSTVSGCGTYCGCDSSTQTCSICCKISGGYCYKDSVPAAPANANHGYKKQACPLCSSTMSGNGICDPECNHADCGFDGGECCAEDMSFDSSSGHPKICLDPQSQYYDASKNFRVDFNAPPCRKAVQDQGSCGSCYAFAVSSAAMYQTCYAAVRQGISFTYEYQDLAPMHIDSCDVYGGPGSGAGLCDGGYTAYAWGAFLDAEGYRPEHCYPYAYDGAAESHFGADVDAVSCEESYAAKTATCTGEENYVLQLTSRAGQTLTSTSGVKYLYLSSSNAAEIRRRLMADGPMPFSYSVYEAFYNLDASTNGPYGAGLYTSGSQGSRYGGHAVMLIGYGEYTLESGATQTFWVFENSWGASSSHDQGVFYMDATVDWYSEVGGYVMAFGNDELAEGEYITVSKSVTTSGSNSASRRKILSVAERNSRLAQVRRQAQETGSPVENFVEEGNSLLSAQGSSTATSCFNSDIAHVLTNIKARATEAGMLDEGRTLQLKDMFTCDVQVTEGRHYILQVSFTDMDGNVLYREFNSTLLLERLYDVQNQALAGEFDMSQFQIHGYVEANHLENAVARESSPETLTETPVTDSPTPAPTSSSMSYAPRMLLVFAAFALALIAGAF